MKDTTCACAELHDVVPVACGPGPWTLGASGYELYVDGYWIKGRRNANVCVMVALQYLLAFFVVDKVSKYT